LRWARASRGAFDPACGRRAVARGWLPKPASETREANEGGSLPDPTLDVPFGEALALAGLDVRVRSPAWLDLGGIAKGYAVDRAVAVLRRRGIAAGIVNAGGDLRVFGPREETIHVRSPFDPSQVVPVAALRDAACATSASGHMLSNGTAGSVAPAPCSVTVIAPTACAADALTKIVWLRGREAARLLRRARAHAFVVEADGTAWRL
ncbi:MAG TPA: FAD:protein FMN transferase, partial [Burkholderiaceae bacterium]|nr:FAD:protein FMN transferase [Burkholderiaceae bacterium]